MVQPARPSAGVRRARGGRGGHLAGRAEETAQHWGREGAPSGCLLLYADTDHAVADAWGTWGEKVYKGETYVGIIRSSFLVDADGGIERAWYKVKPAETVPEAQAALAA